MSGWLQQRSKQLGQRVQCCVRIDSVMSDAAAAVQALALTHCTCATFVGLSARRLCLQNYHCVAIGMPDTAAQHSVVPPSAGVSSVQEQQQQEEEKESSSAHAQQEGALQDAVAAEAGGSAGVEPPSTPPPPPEQLDQEQNQQHADTVEGMPAPARAVTDAGAPAVSTDLVVAKPAACSAGGSLSALGSSSSNSGQAAPGLGRSVLPQLPLPHLLHLELDGCR